MKGEPKAIKAKFDQLLRSPKIRFPSAGDRLSVTNLHGVYIVYSPKGRVAHVGRTVRGKNGIRRRLNNHLYGASSFVTKALKGKGTPRGLLHRSALSGSLGRRRRLKA